MQTVTLSIMNSMGLHARPSAKITNLANQYKSTIQLTANNKTIDAKSIMQVMMLAANQGTSIIVTVDGEDENDAIKALSALFDNHFDEK
jgi:phosphocarrier protein HPr